jgi:tetratricopeptide (TPR) repeat protein
MRQRSTTFILTAVFLFLICPATRATEGENRLAELSAESRLSLLVQQIVTALGEKNFDHAKRTIDEAMKIAPNDPTLRNARAAALIQIEKYDEAKVILDALLAENPEFFQADYNAGEILFLQGDYAGARAHFERLRAKFGQLPLLRFKILLCDLLAGNNTAATQAARAFRFPIDAPAWYFVHAVLAANAGDTREARKLMDVATEIHGKDGTALFTETIETSFFNK